METTENESITVIYAGNPFSVDSDMTVAELREEVGEPTDDIGWFRDEDNQRYILSDRERIGDCVPDGTVIAFGPSGDGKIFG
jgi:hypothetical protein